MELKTGENAKLFSLIKQQINQLWHRYKMLFQLNLLIKERYARIFWIWIFICLSHAALCCMFIQNSLIRRKIISWWLRYYYSVCNIFVNSYTFHLLKKEKVSISKENAFLKSILGPRLVVRRTGRFFFRIWITFQKT